MRCLVEVLFSLRFVIFVRLVCYYYFLLARAVRGEDVSTSVADFCPVREEALDKALNQ
jgi:hypothetical protein